MLADKDRLQRGDHAPSQPEAQSSIRALRDGGEVSKKLTYTSGDDREAGHGRQGRRARKYPARGRIKEETEKLREQVQNLE